MDADMELAVLLIGRAEVTVTDREIALLKLASDFAVAQPCAADLFALIDFVEGK